MKTNENQTQHSSGRAVSDCQEPLVGRLRMHIRDMDTRITMAKVEIREKQAAVDQLENEKWALDRELDKIEKLLIDFV